jgi:hypothetical protein
LDTASRDKSEVHVSAIREFPHGNARRVEARYGVTPLSEFKGLVESLPEGHDLGLVTLIVCQDDDEAGAELFMWLRKQARSKNFSLTTMHGTATTEVAVRALKSRMKIK